MSAEDQTLLVLRDVWVERDEQDARWGEQNHPDGTGPDRWLSLDDAGYLRRHGIRTGELADWARRRCETAHANGAGTYEVILTEEWAEALATADPAQLRAELVQVAAVAVAWVEKIDRDLAAGAPA